MIVTTILTLFGLGFLGFAAFIVYAVWFLGDDDEPFYWDRVLLLIIFAGGLGALLTSISWGRLRRKTSRFPKASSER